MWPSRALALASYAHAACLRRSSHFRTKSNGEVIGCGVLRGLSFLFRVSLLSSQARRRSCLPVMQRFRSTTPPLGLRAPKNRCFMGKGTTYINRKGPLIYTLRSVINRGFATWSVCAVRTIQACGVSAARIVLTRAPQFQCSVCIYVGLRLHSH